MQLKILTLVLFFILSMQLQSQTTYDYLSRPGLTIATEHTHWTSSTYKSGYNFVGDTLMCGENLLVYQSFFPYKTFLRVEGGKVWKKDHYSPCESEQLIYEFDLEVGDTTKAYPLNGYYVVAIGTLTLLNGEERKQIFLASTDHPTPIEWVDGIGRLKGGLFSFADSEGSTSLICVKEKDEAIWLNPDHSLEVCDSIACFNPIPGFDFEVDQSQVNFENQSLYHSHSSVLWDFGDGHTSTELHASHRYETPGCYNVTLSVGSDCLTKNFETQSVVPVCLAPEWRVNTLDFTSEYATLRVDFVNESVGWIIERKHIWKTEDGGVSWTEQFYPIPPEPIIRTLRTLDMVDEMNGVIGVHNINAPGSIEAFLITNDGGLTWEEKMPGSYFLNSAIMTEDGQVFGTRNYHGIFYSNDWGNSFVELPRPGINLSELQYIGNNQLVAMGLHGFPPYLTSAISFSDDSGQSWTHHLLPDVYYGSKGFHFFNANEGFVSGYGGFLLKTVDGGQSWVEVAYDDGRGATNIYFVDEQVGWAVGYGGLLLSTTDGGETWVVGNCGYQNHLLSISALDAENCWIGSFNKKYLKLDTEAEADCSPVLIKELKLDDNNLLIFPNPASDAVTISLANSNVSSANNRIVVYNNLGQNIFEGSIPDETLVINTGAWSSGVYYVILYQNEQVFGTEKLMVFD